MPIYLAILILGVFWAVYGLLGLLGIQVIPPEYQDRKWTKEYQRRRGIGRLAIGLPWCVLAFVCRWLEPSRPVIILLLAVCSVPAILYSYRTERKYREMLQKEEKEN
jgi:hypothetical protein